MVELLWVTKTPDSKSLSRSYDEEHLEILSQAQRTSRRQKAARIKKSKSIATSKISPTTPSSVLASRDLPNIHTCHAKDDVNPRDDSISALYYSSSAPQYSLTIKSDWTLAEIRSAIYFQDVAVHKILTLQRDRDFWKDIVPCSAETYAGIRHLVVAIAATYELLSQPDSEALNQFALKQCNKALRCILAADSCDLSTIMISCILISAYNLLRSDVNAADKSIDSGLMISESVHLHPSNTNLKFLSGILSSLRKQHGYKLWAPDVAFRIDRTVAISGCLIFDSAFLEGPFVDSAQVLDAFKSIIIENVAKPLRNLALGAHIDRHCLWAQHVLQNFSQVFLHWDVYYCSLMKDQVNERLELIQLKIGLLSAYILFNAKVIASDESRVNMYMQEYAEMSKLAEEVINARHANFPVMYLDRIVNGTLFTSAMFCRDPQIKRQLTSLLKSQVIYADGLVNFLRGHIAETLASIEEHGIVVDHCHDIPTSKRIGLVTLSCNIDRILCLGYMMATQTDRSDLKLHSSRLPPELDCFIFEEIDACLKGMLAAFAMYRKVDLSTAPRGYLREMYYAGSPVPVLWRADLQAKNETV